MPTRHPSGVRVFRRDATCEVGPGRDEAELLRLLAREIAASRITDVESLVVDWREDGCYLIVYLSSFVILRDVSTDQREPRHRVRRSGRT
jgi:hypothetical protein